MKPTLLSHPISFAIGIPTLNRWDLLKPSIEKYLLDFPDTKIYIVDNGSQECRVYGPNASNVVSFSEGQNIGVAASWNKLCGVIFSAGHTYSLILNDDIYLGKRTLDIKDMLKTFQAKLFTGMKDFSAFVLPKTTFDWIGPFDEGFFCYYEDADYMYRLKLKGYKPMRTSTLSPAVYRDNSTGDRNPAVHKWSLQSKQRYLQKWGGMPGQEKFTYPFNNKVDVLSR